MEKETLEEVANRLATMIHSRSTDAWYLYKDGIIKGIEWQAEQFFKDDAIQTLEKGIELLLKKQERMYSEEELIRIIKSYQNKPIIVENQLTNKRITSRNWEFDTEYFDNWFEQFKKK